MDTVATIGVVSSVLGILTGIGYFYDKIRATHQNGDTRGAPLFKLLHFNFYIRLTWRQAQRKARRIADKIIADKKGYDLIVGAGRGGAIFGAMLSYALRQLPIVAIDRVYEWKDDRRDEDLLIKPKLSGRGFKRILLVAGEVHSGNTVRQFSEYIQRSTGTRPDVCAFYRQEGCTTELAYYGMAGRTFRIMPWQDSRYIRNSRSREEYERLVDEQRRIGVRAPGKAR